METLRQFTFEEINNILGKIALDRLQDENRWKEAEKRSNDLDRKLKTLSEMYGGISKNNGDMSEEYFYRRLKRHNVIHGITFTHVSRDLKRESGAMDGQYDIVLFNGKYIVIVEVKYKLHPNDIQKFRDKQLPKFKKLFPEYADKTVFVAMAAMVVPDDCKEICQEYGFLLLTQAGKEYTLLNDVDFKPTEY